MKLLFDENVDKRLVKPLSRAGHEIKTAEKGTKNSALFLLAKQEKSIFFNK